MRVVLLAYHDVGCAGLRVLRQAGEQIVAVYTHPDDPEEEQWFGSVAQLARGYGLPTYLPHDINTPRWIERVRSQRPDVIFSLYYRRLVCDEILAIPPRGAMNLHGSLLPHYRGRCPVNWVLIRGESRTGVTLHCMVAKADAGDIVAQRPVAIDPQDTAATLHEKIVAEGAGLLQDILPAIRSGDYPRVRQQIEKGSYFGRRRPEDGAIDWSRDVVAIHNLVRGLARPWPGARTTFGGQKLLIWASEVEADSNGSAPPGTVDLSHGFRIQTGQGRLRVLECQFAGEPRLSGSRMVRRLRDLALAYRTAPGLALARVDAD